MRNATNISIRPFKDGIVAVFWFFFFFVQDVKMIILELLYFGIKFLFPLSKNLNHSFPELQGIVR